MVNDVSGAVEALETAIAVEPTSVVSIFFTFECVFFSLTNLFGVEKIVKNCVYDSKFALYSFRIIFYVELF